MKIRTVSADFLSVKDGSIATVIMGTLFLLLGAALGSYALSSGASSFIPKITAIIFISVGLGSVLFSSSYMIDFDKTAGRITYRKKKIIGSSIATYDIVNVSRIETRKEWRGQTLLSQSVMVFRDGSEVPLNHQKSPQIGTSVLGGGVLFGGSAKEAVFANRVAVFLGVPFQEITPPSIGSNINIGGFGGGIRL